MPPSLVLEVLQILEAEVNLREETRVTEQAREAIDATDFTSRAMDLSATQDTIRERTDDAIARIMELPEAQSQFAKEIGLLTGVSNVMQEATEVLARPDTGKQAIGLETEAIELLLQSKRINPKGGGGGSGSTPGGGGGGTTTDSAMALVGSGVNQNEHREDHGISQSTGEAGVSLPAEFRHGLDQYFNQLEELPRRGS